MRLAPRLVDPPLKLGDDDLKRFSRSLTSQCQNTNFAGRLGGDEFIAFPTESNLDGAKAVTQQRA